ncbi:MAG TPA: UDP-N-acetylmuramoyl-L-alanyl-D-glutamate--2,6-diaminopimelate ligase, partial [Anaerolineaceae bacterium]|nr:UDP-N-acetylmuramoyl-L-alanyl-D-glutamate--2,6-diaminopimelate ligase [Anaerolineaceae bacterium]
MTGYVPQTLGQLLSALALQSDATVPCVPITGVTYDSRLVQPGNVFVALTGGTVDGHRYIPQAIERGAVAVVGSQAMTGLSVPYIQVEDTRKALALLSAAFFRFPARHMTMVGVTGTDGKTTTSSLIYQILIAAGKRTGIISTVNATIGTEVLDTGFHVTTPESPDIQRFLSRMLAAGMTHVVLEATSHGLAQDRVTGCEFDVGVVTNITHEHLDYHGSYENYRAAKTRLFTSLASTVEKSADTPRLAVLNRDDVSYEYLSQATPVRQVSYSLNPGADVWAEAIRYAPDGIHFTARGASFSTPIDVSLVGAFNVSNCLAAIAATVAGMNIPAETAREAIAAFKGVPGRMESIHLGQNFTAIVDFAHTPNALKRALETARAMTQ